MVVQVQKISEMSDSLKQTLAASDLFDYFRLVDPDTHKVYSCGTEGDLCGEKDKCFAAWGKVRPCANCISKKVCRSKRDFIKLEYVGSKSVLAFSHPVTIDGKEMALELIKDVSTSMVFSNSIMSDNSELTHVISELNNLATTESLTGLFNKAFIENEIDINLRYNQDKKLVVVMADINHFKTINDTYGHTVGDQVLVWVSGVFKTAQKDCGCKVGRIGGDEFLLLFEDSDEALVARIASSLKSSVAEHEFTSNGTSFKVDFSFGTAESVTGDTTSSLIDRADKHMYEMKNSK